MLTREHAFAQTNYSKKKLRLLRFAHNLTVASLFLFVTIWALKKGRVISQALSGYYMLSKKGDLSPHGDMIVLYFTMNVLYFTMRRSKQVKVRKIKIYMHD